MHYHHISIFDQSNKIKKMNIYRNITLVAISDVKIKSTITALKKSHKSLKPNKTIFFTSKSIALNSKDKKIIKVVKINPINSIKEYSNFVIYCLHKFIKTTHVLIVQWDGYICNMKKWNANFLNYDYVGAPFIPREFDQDYARDKKGAFYVIGNGGFSIRSKRLLEAPSRYGLSDNKKFTNFHEDGFFSILHRSFLNSKGFLWAPYIVAKQFSIETPLSFDDLKELPFGFHGRKMIYIINLKKIQTKIFRLLKIKNL